MGTNTIIIIILVAYILLTMLLALLKSKQNKTTDDMFNAGGTLGVALIVPLMLSEAIGGSGTVGAATEAMETIGMAAVWTVWGIAIGFFAYRIFFGKFYRTLFVTRGIKCIPSAYELRFDKRTKIVMLVVICVVYICMFALQPVAAASVMAPMFGVSQDTMIMILGVLFVVISCMGGIKGLASMNKMHSFVLIFGLAVVAICSISYGGGWKRVVSELPENYLSPFNAGPRQTIIWAVSGMLAQLSSAFLTTIISSGKTYKDVRLGIDITCLLLIIFAFFPVIIGIAARAVIPEADPATALYSMSATVSPIIGGLAIVAVLAAIFSTAPAFLLIVTSTFTEDFYVAHLKPNATEKETMLVSKAFTVVVGVIAVYLSTRVSSIFNETMQIAQIRAVAAIVLLVSLAWPRVNARAGFWSILSGGVVAIVWYLLDNPPITPEPLIPSLIVGILVLVVLTLMSKEKVSSGYQTYMQLKEEYAKTKG